MARLMRHGCALLAEVAQRPCPGCGGFTSWEPVDVEQPVADAPPPGPTWVCPRCERANPEDRSDCCECASPRPAPGPPGTLVPASVIDGDGGRHMLAPGSSVMIGRTASPAAGALARFTNVSRRHAVVASSAAGLITVTDLNSSNGTWIVGPGGLSRLPAGADALIALGTTIQLGNDARGPNARLVVGPDA